MSVMADIPAGVHILDLRGVPSTSFEEFVREQSEFIATGGSFWVLFDREPTAMYPFFLELGFLEQTFLCMNGECRVFLGRM